MAEPLALAKFWQQKKVGPTEFAKETYSNNIKKDCSSVEYVSTIIFCTIEQDHSTLEHIKPVKANGVP
jgi:hypothetical protein